MREPILKKQIKRDLAKLQKKGKNRDKFKKTIAQLLRNGSLPQKYRPHKLKGNWRGKWECHIESDWLLIYTIEKTTITIYRTGSHDELLK